MTEDEILKNGSKIFQKIFDELGTSEIVDLKVLDNFLGKLLKETKGLIILDFLDSGNWDCLETYEIDYNNEFLTLKWRTLKKEPNSQYYKDSKMKLSFSSILIHFKDLQIKKHTSFPFIALRGYSIKTNEILDYYKKQGYSVEKVKYKRRNFSTEFTVDKNEYIEECDFYDTPIYSIMIIPKDTADSAHFSTKMLFLYNYEKCMERLSIIHNSFIKESLSEDEICEKSNTIRRIFENILKVECCYEREFNTEAIWGNTIDSDHFIFRSDYADALLGELIKILKVVKSEDEVIKMKKIVRLSNELSHDSGKKVTITKARELLDLTADYCLKLGEQISF
jgi:hypothetical protein